ncbi:hypothetical protein JVT61DRAFT_13703 [Boletus reticuloceps]|uniref:Uncharacterized protein n=1 Tax=Boletus reticuloceps TaxID=495285 RepID=A0A8I2YRJ6_9AGAM|nr:hypothetical protein JVT61DRAFT_13703 [Boletus reticuloceps]
MAIEIQSQVHLYIPQAVEDLSTLFAGNTSQSNSPLVVHNFQHDMESIFWILLWTILVHFPCNFNSSKKRSEFAGILSEILQDMSMCNPRCHQVFSQAGPLHDLLAMYLAPQLQSLQSPVDGLRAVLLGGYMNRGYKFGNMPSYSCLYQYLWKVLSLCQQSIQGESLLDLVPCHSFYLNSDAAWAEIVNLPLQVNKRRCNRPGAGGDDNVAGSVKEDAGAGEYRYIVIADLKFF